jgi:epoxyqueuosine reductase QueG
MKESDFSGLVPECCRIGFASIEEYDKDERVNVEAFLGDVKTVIVIAHHVMHSLEWVWFRFSTERLNETCPADLHTKSVSERICNKLNEKGYRSVLLPYPGKCGVTFKTLAIKTGLGELGDSFLFMNADWGPWIHLSVVLTDTDVEFEKTICQEVCDHCGKCVVACPSGAIMENDFDGIKCRDKMRETSKTLGNVPYIYECELCLRACPISEGPEEVLVSFK